MSDTIQTTTMGEDEKEDQPLRVRIKENPRPALFWFSGVLALIILELGRVLGAIGTIGSAIRFALSGIATIPNWFGGNVADALEGTDETIAVIGGALVADTTALLMLFVLASVLTWIVLPWRLIDRIGYESTRRTESIVERVLVTIVLAVGAAIFAFTPVGTFIQAEITFAASVLDSLSSTIPSLTSHELISNQGHRSPDGGWEGTFLGLSPAWAWAIRTTVVFVYAFICLVWAWKGYNIYREHYREADWTPRDDTVRRFRGHYWGLFGLAVVFMFVVMAAWAPAISPVPIEHNVYSPYSHEFEYLGDNGEVETITHGAANLQSQSDGQNTVSPMTYDEYDRFAPLGTTPNGQDLMTNLAHGAQTSLIIGLTAIGLGALIAVVLSLITAYYKGVADILTVLASDTIIAIPAFLLVMLLSVIFSQGNHPIAEPLDGGLLLALILAFAYWPGMWRAIRGPSLQVAEQEWVDAAKSYGQKPSAIMRKHMAPYIAGYIMIYASLLLGTVIIVVAALSFLGLGITSPTPEWGRIIDDGRSYVSTSSWHVSTISGLMIVFVVTAFNALGDGIRDAMDPEADVSDDAAATGGGA